MGWCRLQDLAGSTDAPLAMGLPSQLHASTQSLGTCSSQHHPAGQLQATLAGAAPRTPLKDGMRTLGSAERAAGRAGWRVRAHGAGGLLRALRRRPHRRQVRHSVPARMPLSCTSGTAVLQAPIAQAEWSPASVRWWQGAASAAARAQLPEPYFYTCTPACPAWSWPLLLCPLLDWESAHVRASVILRPPAPWSSAACSPRPPRAGTPSLRAWVRGTASCAACPPSWPRCLRRPPSSRRAPLASPRTASSPPVESLCDPHLRLVMHVSIAPVLAPMWCKCGLSHLRHCKQPSRHGTPSQLCLTVPAAAAWAVWCDRCVQCSSASKSSATASRALCGARRCSACTAWPALRGPAQQSLDRLPAHGTRTCSSA